MFFIVLLALSATAIAGSAAFFSVYGLAHIFSGTFWSVVVMGSSLEAGKLVAASFLYRYWKKTGFILKSYLILGVVALMILTSTGIFGYLSSGYLSDTMPLAQIDKQVELLNSEKTRLIDRKTQIDNQIAQLPTNSIRGRTQLIKQFKDEQKTATDRISALDQQILEVTQKQIQTQAHVGPIIYIAKAFDLQTDDATKYLIYIIIFAFDPMAVALTLAVNIAIRIRDEEKLLAKQQSVPAELVIDPPKDDWDFGVKPPRAWPRPEIKPEPQFLVEEEPIVQEVVEPVIDIVPEPIVQDLIPDEPVVEEVAPVIEEQQPAPVSEIPVTNEKRKAFLLNDSGIGLETNIQKLLQLYKELKQKPQLTTDEQTDFDMIENVLSDHGLLVYLD